MENVKFWGFLQIVPNALDVLVRNFQIVESASKCTYAFKIVSFWNKSVPRSPVSPKWCLELISFTFILAAEICLFANTIRTSSCKYQKYPARLAGSEECGHTWSTATLAFFGIFDALCGSLVRIPYDSCGKLPSSLWMNNIKRTYTSRFLQHVVQEHKELQSSTSAVKRCHECCMTILCDAQLDASKFWLFISDKHIQNILSSLKRTLLRLS